MTEPAAIDKYEAVVTALVGRCHGDPYEAIRALLSANELLENELARMAANLSTGYGRQKERKAPARR